MSILRADSIRDRAGTGAPDFPNGLTGNVTGTATTATTLSGTPNISVGTLGCGNVTSTGDVTGVNATFSGNLTVQGTTTTIDTAVTAVDSLAVDGNVTALGRLGIGTDNTSGEVLTVSGVDAFIRVDRSNNNPGIDLRYQGSSTNRVVIDSTTTGDLRFATGGSTERLRITSDGTAIFKAGLAEKYNKGTTLAAASNNVALSSGNVHRFTSNESGAKTVNFTGVHATLGDGESVSFTVLVTPANAGYINAATVDGVAPGGGLKWSGGSAPSAGGSSGRDVYTFTIFKDGTATNSYEIFGAVQNYA